MVRAYTIMKWIFQLSELCPCIMASSNCYALSVSRGVAAQTRTLNPLYLTSALRGTLSYQLEVK